jgi:hypothetical protein
MDEIRQRVDRHDSTREIDDTIQVTSTLNFSYYQMTLVTPLGLGVWLFFLQAEASNPKKMGPSANLRLGYV